MIRELRLQAGLSQTELSAETGVSKRTIERAENSNTRGMSLHTVKLLAAFFGVDRATLVFGQIDSREAPVFEVNVAQIPIEEDPSNAIPLHVGHSHHADKPLPTIAIVGNGFAGTVTAIRLLEMFETKTRILIFEGREASRFGGLAYGERSAGWEHLMNIQAGRISLFREHPIDFLVWANEEAGRTKWPEKWHEHKFVYFSAVPRRIYGQYLQARLLRSFQDARIRCGASVEFLLGKVVDLEEKSGHAVLRYEVDGDTNEISAAQVVLATGHGAPIVPKVAENLRGHGSFFVSPLGERVVRLAESLTEEQTVLLIGSGQSAYDAVMTLRANGFHGNISLCSRHGFVHSPYPSDHKHDIVRLNYAEMFGGVETANRMQAAIELALSSGRRKMRRFTEDEPDSIVPERILKDLEPWISKFANEAQESEVRIFLRESRSRLVTQRTCVVPEILQQITQELAASTPKLDIFTGTIECMSSGPSGRIRVAMVGESSSNTFDAVICCAGTDADLTASSSPLWKNLLEKRFAVPHRKTGMGIEVDEYGEVVDAQGNLSPIVFAVGAMRQGDEVQRRGRVGAFTFSIGTIRNQGMMAAVRLMRRIEHTEYSEMPFTSRSKLDSEILAAFETLLPNERRRIIDLVKEVQFMPRLDNREFFMQDARERVHTLASEVLTRGSAQVNSFAFWSFIRSEAAKQLTDISRLPEEYPVVRTYGTNNSQRHYEQQICNIELKRLSHLLRADSASLFLYRHAENVLSPFARYRRHDSFQPTKYGEAIAGNLFQAAREQTPFPLKDSCIAPFHTKESLRGLIIHDYGKLPQEIKKSRWQNAERSYPNVMVATVLFEGIPEGIMYFEAALERKFESIDLATLLRCDARLALTLNRAFGNWDGSPVVDRKGEDLSEADLQDAILENVNFQNANFKRAKLCRADLFSAVLSGTWCEFADFTSAKMNHTKIIGTRLNNADLSAANLQAAIIVDSDFSHARMCGVNLAGATLEDSVFHNANFTEVQLHGHNVSGLDFSDCIFRRAHLSKLEGVEAAKWNGCDFQGSTMDHLTLERIPDYVIRKYRETITLID